MSEIQEAIEAAMVRGDQVVIENRALADACEAIGRRREAREYREQADTIERNHREHRRRNA